jgi:hypothetical protein
MHTNIRGEALLATKLEDTCIGSDTDIFKPKVPRKGKVATKANL